MGDYCLSVFLEGAVALRQNYWHGGERSWRRRNAWQPFRKWQWISIVIAATWITFEKGKGCQGGPSARSVRRMPQKSAKKKVKKIEVIEAMLRATDSRDN